MTRASFALCALILAAPAAAQDDPAASPPPHAPSELNLSLQEAVERALKNNVDIAVERYNPESSAEAVREQQGAYDPNLFSTINQNSRTDPARNVFSGGDKVDTDTTTYNFGAAQLLPTGGSLRVDFDNSRAATNNVFSNFNPSFDSSFNLNFTQPLLRSLALDPARFQVRVARKNREISETQFRQTVINTVASVKTLYYDFLYAMDNLDAQRKSLTLAQKLLEENRIRVRVGTMAPLDVVAAESEVASREEAVIVAESALYDAEDALRRAIFPDNQPATWTTHIVPTDRPTAEPLRMDAELAVRNALEKRTDIVAAHRSIDNAELSVKLARSQALPAVDFVANYGTTGVGGTFIEREGLGGPIVRTVPGGFSDALGDVFGRDFPTWSIGVNFAYPLFNRQADAAAARARISHDQAQASLRRLEMQVTGEVRSAVRAVDTNYKRVESTRAARTLQERRLDAEQKKFAAGLSTNFLVTQAQRDLAVAEVAELRAIADYRKSVVNFERVQEAGGSSVSFSGGGTSARTGTTSTNTGQTTTGQSQP